MGREKKGKKEKIFGPGETWSSGELQIFPWAAQFTCSKPEELLDFSCFILLEDTVRGEAEEEAGMGVSIPGCCGKGWRASGTPMEHRPSSAAGVLIQGYLKFQLFMCSCCGLMLTDTKTLPRFSFIKFLSLLWTASLSPISFKGNRVLKSLLRNSWATSYNLTFPPSQILGLHYHGNIS